MAITSYFYDSLNGDRPYSAADFSKAFGMVFETGIIADDETGKLGFDFSSSASTIDIGAGRAVIKGHFIEVTGMETIPILSGTYSGQVVIRLDITGERRAQIVLKTDRVPTQDAALYEFPLYNVDVKDGFISTTRVDLREQGGAVPRTAANVVTWQGDPNGVRIYPGLFSTTGKPVILYLTSVAPTPSPDSHRVWIQIDKF